MKYNQEVAKRIFKTAERSINIVKLIMTDKSDLQIVEEIGCDRQLVQYYRKQLTQKNV